MAPAKLSDEEIKKKIVDHLYWSNKVDASDVNVGVNHNEVTLTGSVDSIRMKRDVENLVYDISGVYSLDNDLEVIPVLEETTTDEEIRERVEETIVWDSDIDFTHIEVTVSNGIVTMKGSVDENWKIMYTLSKVEELKGVVNVINELSVVPEMDIEDEIIADDLMDAFERNFAINPDPIEVRVEDGEVYLEGSVTNREEESEIYTTAIQTPGVQRVINNMIVESRA